MIVLLGDSFFVQMNKTQFIPNSLCLATNGASVTKLLTNPWLYTIIHTNYFHSHPGKDHSQDTLLLLAGTNDFLRNVPLADIKKGHKKTVNYCLRRFNHVVLCQIPPIPLLSLEVNETIRLFNRWLDDVYRTHPRVTVVPSHKPFLSSSFPRNLQPNLRYYEISCPSRSSPEQ